VINNLKKIDISKELSGKKGYSLNLSKKILNNLLESIVFCIKEDVLILKNIGVFKILDKKERIGRNPSTKETFTISSRKSLSFIPAKRLSKIINQKK
jgi:integration host factor subunit alpha